MAVLVMFIMLVCLCLLWWPWATLSARLMRNLSPKRRGIRALFLGGDYLLGAILATLVGALLVITLRVDGQNIFAVCMVGLFVGAVGVRLLQIFRERCEWSALNRRRDPALSPASHSEGRPEKVSRTLSRMIVNALREADPSQPRR